MRYIVVWSNDGECGWEFARSHEEARACAEKVALDDHDKSVFITRVTHEVSVDTVTKVTVEAIE